MLINANRQGAKEVNPLSAMQEQAALNVLALQNGSSQDAHDTAMANLVAYHNGDESAANATLKTLLDKRRRGKR